MTATIPTAIGRCRRSSTSSRTMRRRSRLRCEPIRPSPRCAARSTGYLVRTNRGDWRCRTVVLASGACNIARVPSFAARVPPSVATLTAQSYRNPAQLADGGVLVVGASCERHPDRARAAALGASGHAVGRRAHPGAARLSRQGPGMVDGRRRRARRALRPGGRHRAGATGSLAAACRHARPLHPRPQLPSPTSA